MGGLVQRVEVRAHGPVDDRRWCLVDPARDRVLRTVENPTLLAAVARTDGETLTVDSAFVEQQLAGIAKNADLSRYVL